MASRKDYTYQIKGNKLSLLERDQTSGTGLNYVYAGVDGDGVMDGTTSGSIKLTSPTTAVTDGIEIEYAYSPSYRNNDVSDMVDMTGYTETGGLLTITVESVAVVTNEWILISGSNKWNGLHQVNAGGTLTTIVLKTKYNGAAVTGLTATLSHDISVLEDESYTIDLPAYLSKALVYYVKAKVAEDQMNIEAKEYMMREFRRMLEKHESSKVAGPRGVMTGSHSIR